MMGTYAEPMFEESESSVHLYLSRADTERIKDFKPGQAVRLVLRGKIDSVNLSKEQVEKQGYNGSLCVTLTEVRAARVSPSAIDELMEDEDE